MSRNSRRAVATAVAGVFAIAPLVTACAAGQHPQSVLPTRLAEGVNASAHQVDIRNAFLLGPAPGQRLTAGGSAPLYAWFVNNAASPDRLIAAEAPGVAQSVQIAGGTLDLPPNKLVNTVQTPDARPVPPATPATSATPKVTKHRAAEPGQKPGAPLRRTPTPGTSASDTPGTPASGMATTTAPAAPPAPSSKLILQGLASDFSGGETVKVTLHFQQAGTITLNVPVVPRSGYYGTYSPAPGAPTPSATPPAPQPSTTAPGGDTSLKAGARAKKKKKASATPAA